MIQRKYIRTRQLQPGMKLDHPVVDRLGRNLVARGAVLDEYMIASMIQMGIMSVYIQIDDGVSEEENSLSVSPTAQENIEKLRTEDRAKVTLSASVRERVATGIQFIYNNPESPEIDKATNYIADSLMDSINQNNAIAIDISALKTSDEYTFKHSVDVATISMIVAKQQGMNSNQIREIGVAGLLHDIGKTKVPTNILNKPGKLNNQEFEIMKQHTLIGAQMLDSLEMYHDEEMMKYAYEICRWHHERYDGKGYPDGLKGEEIPLSAQVVSLADVYDALVSDRVYKKAYSHEKAMEMILNGECGMFNPLLLECLVEIQDKVCKELGIKGVNECLEYLEERNR